MAPHPKAVCVVFAVREGIADANMQPNTFLNSMFLWTHFKNTHLKKPLGMILFFSFTTIFQSEERSIHDQLYC